MNTKATHADVKCVRAMLITHLLATPPRTADEVRQTVRLLDTVDRVLDAASAHTADDVTEPEPEPSGEWITWEGGSRPHPVGTQVEVELRDGDAFDECVDYLRWNHKNDNGDIVRYRVIEAAPGVE